jgi:excisionase family DNA binding protein
MTDMPTSPESESIQMDGEVLLSVTDISRRLCVHRALVLGWIRSKELPAFDLGRGSIPYFRVKRSDLDAFLVARSDHSGASRAPLESATGEEGADGLCGTDGASGVGASAPLVVTPSPVDARS